MHLKPAGGPLSAGVVFSEDVSQPDQVLPAADTSQCWGLWRLVLHVVDPKADSADQCRRWHATGHRALMRVDDRRVKVDRYSHLLSEIAAETQRKQMIGPIRPAEY